jgi:hypothetical protein
MPIIEKYAFEKASGPRRCEESLPDGFRINRDDEDASCFAEVILHTEQGEKFLCKRHASYELRDNPTLLAAAVIELSLSV